MLSLKATKYLKLVDITELQICFPGTPNEDTWPGVTQLPDYKPLPVYQPSLGLAQVVPRLPARGRDLLARLLTCNPALRMPADDAMAHAYFHDLNPSVKNDRC